MQYNDAIGREIGVKLLRLASMLEKTSIPQMNSIPYYQ